MLKVGANSTGTMNPVCDTVTTTQIDDGQEIHLYCNKEGRYLAIELANKDFLNFCEIKAFEGDCQGKGTSNVVLFVFLILNASQISVFVK